MVQITDSSLIIPDLRTVFTPFYVVKNRQGLKQFIPNLLQIENKQMTIIVRKYGLTAWEPILTLKHWCIS